MKENKSWSPLGCGPYYGDYPDFPGDLWPRLRHLDLGPEDLFPAWELARLAPGIKDPGRQRALMLLVLAARFVTAEGGTRLSLEAGGQLDRVLQEFSVTPEERAALDELLEEGRKVAGALNGSSLDGIFGGPGDYRPLIIDHGCLYLQKLHVLEARVGEKLRRLMEMDAVSDKEDFMTPENILEEVFNLPPVGLYGKAALDPEQKAAVRTALSGPLAVISGRPGSGKTSIVASVLRVLARVGEPPLESIALAAPTGKAAERLRQSITDHLAGIPDAGKADRRLTEACPPSVTLHRLLGYSPGRDRFWHHEDNPLSEKLVIVDESSMVDLAMMDRLLRALRPGARVVFLGDADQLPSIDTGAVLRDICRSRTANKLGRVAVLQTSYRARAEDPFGRSILDTAEALNKGRLPGGEILAVRKKVSELHFQGAEQLPVEDEEQLFAFLERWLKKLAGEMPDLQERLASEYSYGAAGFDEETAGSLKALLGQYEKFRILCVTRVAAGGTGVEAVNSWFHRQWSSVLQPGIGGAGKPNIRVGEPVLVTRNYYNLRLYNGDSGLVLKVNLEREGISKGAEPMAVFPRGGSFVAYPLGTLRGSLELAWATTVHKAQGSEYDHVAILLPRVHLRPLTRELLYTAVTRARKSALLAGSPAVLAAGIQRRVERASGLADLLD